MIDERKKSLNLKGVVGILKNEEASVKMKKQFSHGKFVLLPKFAGIRQNGDCYGYI